jgi:hypothetical protein
VLFLVKSGQGFRMKPLIHGYNMEKKTLKRTKSENSKENE